MNATFQFDLLLDLARQRYDDRHLPESMNGHLHGYSPKEHSLITLSGRAKTHSLESSEAFPRDTEEEKRLFDLLQDAYVQARYNLHFRVTKEDIEALIPKVERLRDITRQCCEERIKVYAAKQRQV